MAVLDCDDKTRAGTFATAQRWLDGLGISAGDYPVVQTASGNGRHIYLTFGGGLAGEYRNLAPTFGAGEFRFSRGAYAAAPPSTVGGSAYVLVAGDFARLPALTVADVQPILKNAEPVDLRADARSSADRSIRLPRRALALLRGEDLDRYESASNAEQAIITSLVNAGFTFLEVLHLFLRFPAAGKFGGLHSENAKNATRWLRLSYDKAAQWSATHTSKGRQEADCIIAWAASTPWPGRTGAVDRAVFIAHATIARRAGALTYAASCRSLAELAAVTWKTAALATMRLCSLSRIELVAGASGEFASIYRIGQTVTLPLSPPWGSV